MTTITNAGVGSGLDLETLISNLVTADKTPTQTRLTQKQSTLSTQLSAVGTFKAVLSNLQSKLDALKSGGSVATLSAASSDLAKFTAPTTSAATRGNYSVERSEERRGGKECVRTGKSRWSADH